MAVLLPWTQTYNQNHHIIFLNVNMSYFALCLNMTSSSVWCFPLVFLPLKDQTVDPITRKITGNQGNCWLVHINETLTLGRHFNQCLLFRGVPMIVTIIRDIQTPSACLPVELQPKRFGSSILQQNNFFFNTKVRVLWTNLVKPHWNSNTQMTLVEWVMPAEVGLGGEPFTTSKGSHSCSMI